MEIEQNKHMLDDILPVVHPSYKTCFKLILCSYLILKKRNNERIKNSQYLNKYTYCTYITNLSLNTFLDKKAKIAESQRVSGHLRCSNIHDDRHKL